MKAEVTVSEWVSKAAKAVCSPRPQLRVRAWTNAGSCHVFDVSGYGVGVAYGDPYLCAWLCAYLAFVCASDARGVHGCVGSYCSDFVYGSASVRPNRTNCTKTRSVRASESASERQTVHHIEGARK